MTTPLPRVDARDRRTRAQRTPSIPVTVWAHVRSQAHTVHTLVGSGGWDSDAVHAAARALGVDAAAVTVVAAQGGHV